MSEDQAMARPIFTLGYQQRSIDEYVATLVRSGVTVLVDVRETAWSRKPGFSKTSLQQRLCAAGISYVHARFAGNPRRIRSEASSHEEVLRDYRTYLQQAPQVVSELGDLLGRLVNSGHRPCLMCYERHPGDCHRSVLLSAWLGRPSAEGVEVRHLDCSGAPRLMRQTGRLAAAG